MNKNKKVVKNKKRTIRKMNEGKQTDINLATNPQELK